MGDGTRKHGWRTAKAPSHLRGYGADHKKERAKWVLYCNGVWSKGGQVFCWRCGGDIQPYSKWELGHDDNDRTQYKGPEHPSCNRRGASAKAHSNRRKNDPKPKPQTKW